MQFNTIFQTLMNIKLYETIIQLTRYRILLYLAFFNFFMYFFFKYLINKPIVYSAHYTLSLGLLSFKRINRMTTVVKREAILNKIIFGFSNLFKNNNMPK